MKIERIAILIGLIMVPFLASAGDESGAEIVQIGRNVWVHTSYATINGYRTGSNGMVVMLRKESYW